MFVHWELTAVEKGLGCRVFYVMTFSGKTEGLCINSSLLICGLPQDVTQ